MDDPITAVYMAGSGMTADDDESVEIAEELLKCAERVIYSYWVAQCDAAAKLCLIVSLLQISFISLLIRLHLAQMSLTGLSLSQCSSA